MQDHFSGSVLRINDLRNTLAINIIISVDGSRGGRDSSLGSGVFPDCCLETGREIQQRNPDPSQKLSEETFLEKITQQRAVSALSSLQPPPNIFVVNLIEIMTK